MILEPACARLAVERISPDEVIKLEENLSSCEKMLKKQTKNSVKMLSK
jgi:DNA-binding GntR family transcriptional regulator